MASVHTSARAAKPSSNGHHAPQPAPQPVQTPRRPSRVVQPAPEPSNAHDSVQAVFRHLAEPFDPSEIRTRPGRNGEVYRFITARMARERLNSAVGADRWQSDVVAVPNGFACSLTIELPDGRSITRTAVGAVPDSPGLSPEDATKAADSDAFKRACVMFGIGEYLYDADPTPARAGNGRQRTSGERRAGAHGRDMPKTGAALYAWAADRDLLQDISRIGHKLGFGGRITAWTGDQVAAALDHLG